LPFWSEPRKALDEAGAETRIISPKANRVRSWNFTDWDQELPVDVQLAQAKPKDFDSLLLPGGVINPDALRIQPEAIAFVRSFFDASKPVAAICHGPWIVIEAGAARGRRMTSLAIAKDRPKECRSGLGRSRGRCRSGPGDKPQP
jgi:protease I